MKELKPTSNPNNITNYIIDTAIYNKDKAKAYRRWFGKEPKAGDIYNLEKSDAFNGIVATIGSSLVARIRDRVAKAMLRKLDLQDKSMDMAEELLDEAETHKDKVEALRAVNSVIAVKVADKFDLTTPDAIKVIDADVKEPDKDLIGGLIE